MKKVELTLSIPPSVNHAYTKIRGGSGHRGMMLTEAAKNWKLMAAWAAKAAIQKAQWELPKPDAKVVLELVAFWPDGRRRDMNNTHKLLCDALEGWLYLDDKMVLVRDMDFAVDRKNPRLEVRVYVKETNDE